jgi:hypothetical protein
MAGLSQKQRKESALALLSPGEKFGKLEVVGVVTDYYRCRCLNCGSDGVLASGDALRNRRASQCFDCSQLQKMSPHEKVVLAFRRRLDLSPEREEIDHAA